MLWISFDKYYKYVYHPLIRLLYIYVYNDCPPQKYILGENRVSKYWDIYIEVQVPTQDPPSRQFTGENVLAIIFHPTKERFGTSQVHDRILTGKNSMYWVEQYINSNYL